MNKISSIPIFCATTIVLAACGGGNSSGGGSANIAPTAVNDSTSTTTAAAVEINVVTNDTDSDGTIDATSVAIIGSGPADGSASINATTGVITYTSNANFVGTDTFDYTVKDNDGDISNTATVTIEVANSTAEEDIRLIGIPRSMVSAVCLDSNSNKLCEAAEELEYRYDFGGASIYQPPRNPPTGKEIIVVVRDPAKINHFEETMLTFPGDTKELSMKSLLNSPVANAIIKTGEDDLAVFLAHQQNLNLLGQNGLSAQEASAAGLIKVDYEISQLSNIETEEFATEEGRAEFQDLIRYTPDEAYDVAKDVRGEEKALVNDKLVEQFQCETNQLRTVQRYGIEDVFDLSNGTEQTYPSTSIIADPNLAASAQLSSAFGGGFVTYDDLNNDRYFADEIKNLPSGIIKGRIFIGLKSNGSSLQHNDALHIGAYGIQHYGEHLQDLTNPVNASSPWEHQLVNSSNPTTDVYWNDFGALNLAGGTVGVAGNGGTLLSYVQANNNFDVFVQDDTSVDFITVATCSKKDPVVEITPILEKFQCKAAAGPDNETRVTILGGTVDAYGSGVDTSATASSALVNAAAIGYPPGTIGYDATNYDKAFIDTLTMPTGGYITRARLSVGVKALGSSLHSNDRVYLGYTDSVNVAAFDLYGSSGTSVNTPSNLWSITPISNGERVIQTDFLGTNANSLAWLRTQSAFDILIQDDTSVDFTQLDLCMREKPPFVDTDGDGFSDEDEIEAGSNPENPESTPDDIDGDGVPNKEDCDPFDPDLNTDCESKLPASCDTAVTVDLRQAASWLNASGVAPTENNVFTSTPHVAVWDPALNWFDFGSASNTEHELKIDFCSCGGGDVTVDEMKSDNYSSVKLDNGTAIVERTAYSQSTMATWGPSVSGTESFPYSGNGVNHSLIFKVKNVGGPSGGGIDGTLGFTGHLGKCNDQDVLPK